MSLGAKLVLGFGPDIKPLVESVEKMGAKLDRIAELLEKLLAEAQKEKP